jgi:hypothetical protein
MFYVELFINSAIRVSVQLIMSKTGHVLKIMSV